MLKILVVFVVGTSSWSCAGKELSSAPSAGSRPAHLVSQCPCAWCPGFPVYDYDLPSLREALGASVAEVNSRALGPYLFRAFRSSVRRVSRPPTPHPPAALCCFLPFSFRQFVGSTLLYFSSLN